MTLKITITDAGRAELIQNSHLGFNAVTIVALDLGDAQYLPDRAQTALGHKVARLNSIAGTAVGDGILHVTARDESAAAYNVGEFGLITDKGTLFAVCALPASAGWIIQKAAPSILLLATDVLLEEIDAEQIRFGDVVFLNPPATTEMAGVVELASAEEMAAGTDNRRAATPAGVAQEAAKRQPLDATLSALAQLVTAANQLIYATGPDKFAMTALTAFARTLLDDADAAAARITLGAAPLDSPGLTGTPTAPTAPAGTNSTQIATTAFVRAALAALVGSSPAALDTLNELAAALGNDPNFATTMTNALAGKQPLDATLTALAGLTTAANQLIYSTGADQFAVTALSAFARTLLDDADAAAARVTLGAAPLASPALTGTPTAPTAAAGTNSTQIATTAFVRAAIAALVGSSPAALDTLNELAAALGNDPNFATTMTNALANKVDKVTGKGLSTNDFTAALLTKLNGIATGATANATDAQLRARSTHTGEQAISTITGLATALAALAPLASPALTGTPTAPTAAAGTNSTQIATTAFVRAAIAALVGSSPATLDTLNELASALGNDPNFATTMTNALAGKLGKTETAAKATALASNIVINGVPVNAGSNVSISADATAASVLAANAAAGIGAIGTYALCINKMAGIAEPGALVAGSSLYYGGTSSQGSTTLPGTWRCMGRASSGNLTNFLRVS